MIIGIVLAAGKGTRFGKKSINKTTINFFEIPLVCYGTDLFIKTCDRGDVIRSVGKNKKFIFAYQKKRLGTGHAVRVAVGEIIRRKWNPGKVCVGMGDHMMFYKPEIIADLARKINGKRSVISLITCEHKNPDSLAWGRIIRNEGGDVTAIIEQKYATKKQRKIKELNAGLYCFDFDFLKRALTKIKKASKSGEYYLTDIVKVASEVNKCIVAVKVPFKYVGIGINTQGELAESQKLFKRLNR